MPTEKHVINFVINKVPTKSIFEIDNLNENWRYFHAYRKTCYQFCHK
uniref:Uncharacterized protein n=1 Tax=Siphoviridae sp. ctgN495 TaxID=2825608 RepID=A0A8S5UCX2_9CAUD|nr:MAG TPA: hypothetical protein [Siphoviridae sp. ctgN495]